MKRILALVLCLAAVWLLYGLAVEHFIAWYGAVEMTADIGPWGWGTTAAQLVVCVGALVLAGRIVRAPSKAP